MGLIKWIKEIDGIQYYSTKRKLNEVLFVGYGWTWKNKIEYIWKIYLS